ncbi:MAG: hypothetical protein FLDDKLPJ_02830 [Phycisphaerae bacterium]|nr:hypothetical protein [Phycisphaerae bacterium]
MRSGRMMLGIVVGSACLGGTAARAEVGSVVTYQGRLNQDGSPLNGTADFRCTLFDADIDGTAVAGPLEFVAVNVVDGLFTLPLDFGAAAFNGGARWLEIEVASPSGGTYTTLTPRQSITATPYALRTRGLAVDDAGNVGIGTNAPVAQLDVRGAGGVNVFAGDLDPFGIAGFETNFESPQTHAWFAEGGARVFSLTGGGEGYFAGRVFASGFMFPGAFGPDENYVGQAGNYLAFGHSGASEDFMGYANQTFFFKDSPGGGDETQPNVVVGGKLGVGVDEPAAALHVAGEPGVDGIMFPDGTLQTTAASAGWSLSGNSNTNPGLHFVGTTDHHPVSFRVNNMRALRLQYGSDGNATGVNVIGGGGANSIPNNVIAATVFGGNDFVGNSANASWSTVAGGLACSISAGADKAFLGSGQNNNISGSTSVLVGGASNSVSGVYGSLVGGHNNRASAWYTSVGGGVGNHASVSSATISGGSSNNAGGDTSAIGGGYQNTTSGVYTAIGGGAQNVARANSSNVGGGQGNQAGLDGDDDFATVAGGTSNYAGWHATVGGGTSNQATGGNSVVAGGDRSVASHNASAALGGTLNTSSGENSTTLGGMQNTAASFTDVTVGGYQNRAAGGYSLAAGHLAKANHIGSFVWSGWENPGGDFATTGNSQFLVRAAGGVGINMNAPTTALHVNGTITGSVKNFVIDHPLDPANWTLRHACIESNEMLNIYSGNVVTDDDGYATVTVPEWFTSLNTNFRYQLTVVDGAGDEFVQVRVARKLQDNRFVIRASHADVEVSWQITGVRNDAFARAHPLVVEEAKPEFQRGYYLNPEEHGLGADRSVNAARAPKAVNPVIEPAVESNGQQLSGGDSE